MLFRYFYEPWNRLLSWCDGISSKIHSLGVKKEVIGTFLHFPLLTFFVQNVLRRGVKSFIKRHTELLCFARHIFLIPFRKRDRQWKQNIRVATLMVFLWCTQHIFHAVAWTATLCNYLLLKMCFFTCVNKTIL